MQNFEFKCDKDIDKEKLRELFASAEWTTAKYPNRLYAAIKNSDYVESIWNGEKLVGLISAISDGYLNVYITYLIIKPEYQRMGLGKKLVDGFCKRYEGIGRRLLTTGLDKEEFYNKCGFKTKDSIAMFNKDWREDIEFQ